MRVEADVRDVLPAIRVPTLVLYRTRHRDRSLYAADRIPQSTAVEVPGGDHSIFVEGSHVADAIERFLSRVPHESPADRVLATVLFTDIVESTAQAAALGDRRWRELLDQHDSIVRWQLGRFRGRELDTADGVFAAFDGPGRAISCACALRDELRRLGLEIRAGVHTGECERRGDKLSGIAVPTGARVADLARPGDVLVSSTVRDLVAGSGIAFEDRGDHELKGVPGMWRLHAVTAA